MTVCRNRISRPEQALSRLTGPTHSDRERVMSMSEHTTSARVFGQAEEICQETGCQRKSNRNGFCWTHYDKRRASGTIPAPTIPALPVQEGVEFQHVVDFPGYCVGDDGSVWSCLSRNGIGRPKNVWRKLSPGNCRGYHLHGLRKNGRSYTRLAHRLVLEAFVGPCPPGMECCHNDGDRGNSALSNIRWDTRKANHADALAHGTHPRGEHHGCSKINDAVALLILREAASGKQQRTIARELGLTDSLVSNVVRRKSWTHVSL